MQKTAVQQPVSIGSQEEPKGPLRNNGHRVNATENTSLDPLSSKFTKTFAYISKNDTVELIKGN